MVPKRIETLSDTTTKMLDKDKLFIVVHLGIKLLDDSDVPQYIEEVALHIDEGFDESIKVLVLPTRAQSEITLEFFNASAMKYETAEEFTTLMKRLENIKNDLEKI